MKRAEYWIPTGTQVDLLALRDLKQGYHYFPGFLSQEQHHQGIARDGKRQGSDLFFRVMGRVTMRVPRGSVAVYTDGG